MGITLISFYKRKWELCNVIYERAPVQGPGVNNFSTISKQPSINSVSSSLLVLTCQEPRGFHSKQRRPRQSEANATSPISTMMIIVERQRVWTLKRHKLGDRSNMRRQSLSNTNLFNIFGESNHHHQSHQKNYEKTSSQAPSYASAKLRPTQRLSYFL